jgi:DNA-binding NarL/FixJ family response regulator
MKIEIETIDPSLMTDRQMLVIALIVEGQTITQIANTIGVSRQTVYKIKQNALKSSEMARLSTVYQELYA